MSWVNKKRPGMSRIENSDWVRKAAASADRQTLYGFAGRQGLAVETFEVSGIHLAVGHVDAGSRTVTASGSGFAQEDAVAACIGEAAEFLSWQWRPEDRERLVPAAERADWKKIDARAVLGFSARQIERRNRLNRLWDGFDRIPPEAALDDPGAFVPVSDFEGRAQALCPAFLAFGGFGTAHGEPTLDTDSNGCAAAPTPDEAKARALLELVERDATGLWWHLGLVAPRYERNHVADPVLYEAVEAHRDDTGRRLWFLDISALREATVIAAVSCEQDGSRAMFGFGAAFDVASAARGAFCELVQGEVALEAWQMRQTTDQPPAPEDRRIAKWLRRADVRMMRFVIGTESQWPDRPASNADRLLREVRHTIGEPWFADLSRADIGIPVAKAIVPGMTHFKPRLGAGRLSASPRADRATRAPIQSPSHMLLV